ncbi:hypothetical protein GCM10027072_03670 [Streptomyces bullii]
MPIGMGEPLRVSARDSLGAEEALPLAVGTDAVGDWLLVGCGRPGPGGGVYPGVGAAVGAEDGGR